MKFKVSYSIVTEESAQHGDIAWHGYVTDTGDTPREEFDPSVEPAQFTLREAIDLIKDHKGYNMPEPDCWPMEQGIRSISVDDWEGYMKQYNTTLTLHLPASISPASSLRIWKLLDS